MLSTSAILKLNVFSDTWRTLVSYTFKSAFIDFPYTSYDTLRSILISPLLEGGVIVLVIRLCAMGRKDYLIPFIAIMVLAYFSHGRGLDGINASIAFFYFTLVYILTLKTLRQSHVKAYILSTISHSVYNFLGVFVTNVYLTG